MISEYTKIAGLILASLLAAVTLLHIYWGFGGTWALRASIGEGNPLPPNWAIWVVALALAIASMGVLGQIGLWGDWIPTMLFRVGVWLLFACLMFATFLNASTGRPWEMFLIAPFCAILSVLAFVVARAS
jgi:hypothetical protein